MAWKGISDNGTSGVPNDQLTNELKCTVVRHLEQRIEIADRLDMIEQSHHADPAATPGHRQRIEHRAVADDIAGKLFSR
jgi:hypothetical protein